MFVTILPPSIALGFDFFLGVSCRASFTTPVVVSSVAESFAPLICSSNAFSGIRAISCQREDWSLLMPKSFKFDPVVAFLGTAGRRREATTVKSARQLFARPAVSLPPRSSEPQAQDLRSPRISEPLLPCRECPSLRRQTPLLRWPAERGPEAQVAASRLPVPLLQLPEDSPEFCCERGMFSVSPRGLPFVSISSVSFRPNQLLISAPPFPLSGA